jgi:hypothetical protein
LPAGQDVTSGALVAAFGVLDAAGWRLEMYQLTAQDSSIILETALINIYINIFVWKHAENHNIISKLI